MFMPLYIYFPFPRKPLIYKPQFGPLAARKINNYTPLYIILNYVKIIVILEDLN